jgi:hypothetical protein
MPFLAAPRSLQGSLQEKGGLSPTISFGGMPTREANVSIAMIRRYWRLANRDCT